MNVIIYYFISFIAGLFIINPTGMPLYMLLVILFGAFYEVATIIHRWIKGD